MKRQTIKDYHELNGCINVCAMNSREMTDEEKNNYNQALTLLLGSDFEITVCDKLSRNRIASFSITKGTVSVEIDDAISMDC